MVEGVGLQIRWLIARVGSNPTADSMVTLAKIVVGLFLMALSVCLGGMTWGMWEMAIWPHGEIMKQLQWTTAFIALLSSALTLALGLFSLVVMFSQEKPNDGPRCTT